MVEPQIVVLDVAGSSPVGHPTLDTGCFSFDIPHKMAASATLCFQNGSGLFILPIR
jgi:hypothetical protein